MKFSANEDCIQVVDGAPDVVNIINELTMDGTTNNEDPFYIFDIGDVVKKHQMWIERMPRVVPHYAVKCNDNDVVLATLAALGTSFDCASKGEISKILSLGVSPEKIIFANPAKSKSSIIYARETGVKMMTFDCEIELQKIKRCYPDASLVLRIRCEAELAQCALGKKFGCDPVTEAPKLLKAARSMNLNVVGISFHVGSGCSDFPVYRKALAFCKDLFMKAEDLGYSLTIVDVGGGFQGNSDASIDEVSTIINQSLDEFFPEKHIRVIGEPGRYYVASAFTLVTNVHSKKDFANPMTNALESTMLYVNDGVYGSFNCLLYDHQVVKPKLLKSHDENERQVKTTIFGPTCDALDEIVVGMDLPESIDLGDFIYFENMGAYTIPVASPFNGFPLPKVYHFIDRDMWQMIRSMIPIEADDKFIEDFIGKTIEVVSTTA